ncbi:fructose-6-phosphate aldolase [Nitratidesulfovibrio liaohensis]|uniref:fructose-6-phosphate aldolase n=1 Tax=Nitratidesulfovibrio liaohensis TaxID=2604158 RepID=UPI0014241CF3|nr:fructose-6-phosphate aldolase [Nitratidesulfovibrio liaohensis]NHZ47996.1 fructose-6-phosphate aldolase [Nitratidesulfovibrio liaohensis]
MQFFLDTANLAEMRAAKAWGLLDGVTTNPTLMAREGGDWRAVMQAICREVEGPVSLEAVGDTADELIAMGLDLVRNGPNVVVKIPMTPEGLKAVRVLRSKGVDTNVTLVFSPMQALLAAKAGASFISPFVGRLDGLSQDGMQLVADIMAILRNYSMEARVIVASVRHPRHVAEAALMGAHVATVPFAVLRQMFDHPLTSAGLEMFNKDWAALNG